MKDKFQHFNELVRSLSHNSSISFKLSFCWMLKFYEICEKDEEKNLENSLSRYSESFCT